jgi:diguanylate cyclase (GGDEF)-like protein/PAS domain S-box-containing protein
MCPEMLSDAGIAVTTEFYKELLDHMSDGVYFVDRNRRILYWNQGATRLTGYRPEEIVGRHCDNDTLCHLDETGKHLCKDGCPLTACINDGSSHAADVFLRHKQGRYVPVSVRVQPIRAADGSIVGAVEVFNDISVQYAERIKAHEMERLAFLDELTQLPNRRYVEEALDRELEQYQRNGEPFGVLVIDIDSFKLINDDFGHLYGDHALAQVARTLSAVLRSSDVVGRWGGDEFLAIIRHTSGNLLEVLAERCCTLVSKTSITNGDEAPVFLSISIGGTLARKNDTAEDLIHRADELMYESKATCRGQSTIDS